MAIQPISSRPGAGFGDGGVLDGAVPGVPLAGRADAVTRGGLAGLDDDELMGVLRAWRRPAGQSAPAGPGEFPAQLSEFIGDEVAAALTLTGRTASTYTELALDLAIRLPLTAVALRE